MGVFLVKPDEGRKGGKPKLSWLKFIENYLKSSEHKRWRNTVEYRSACAIIMRGAG
jgi:hypothetical protein